MGVYRAEGMAGLWKGSRPSILKVGGGGRMIHTVWKVSRTSIHKVGGGAHDPHIVEGEGGHILNAKPLPPSLLQCASPPFSIYPVPHMNLPPTRRQPQLQRSRSPATKSSPRCCSRPRPQREDLLQPQRRGKYRSRGPRRRWRRQRGSYRAAVQGSDGERKSPTDDIQTTGSSHPNIVVPVL